MKKKKEKKKFNKNNRNNNNNNKDLKYHTSLTKTRIRRPLKPSLVLGKSRASSWSPVMQAIELSAAARCFVWQ